VIRCRSITRLANRPVIEPDVTGNILDARWTAIYVVRRRFVNLTSTTRATVLLPSKTLTIRNAFPRTLRDLQVLFLFFFFFRFQLPWDLVHRVHFIVTSRIDGRKNNDAFFESLSRPRGHEFFDWALKGHHNVRLFDNVSEEHIVIHDTWAEVSGYVLRRRTTVKTHTRPRRSKQILSHTRAHVQ
jgi:hypothetical protein